MRLKLAIPCCLFMLAACQPPGGPTPAAEQAAAVAEEAVATAPAPQRAAPKVAGALKSPLPESFELPFDFHRLYDNSGRTDTGSPQRRVLVEYLGADAEEVRSALAAALREKGFSDPVTTPADNGAIKLEFTRGDGASVVATITPGRENPRAPNAEGLVHLVWNAG